MKKWCLPIGGTSSVVDFYGRRNVRLYTQCQGQRKDGGRKLYLGPPINGGVGYMGLNTGCGVYGVNEWMCV